MMKDKRLMAEVKDSRKYIGFQVLLQWMKLTANIIIIFYIGRLLQDTITQTYQVSVLHTLLVCVGMVIIRFFATIGANRMSYQAVAKVKQKLRDSLYQKLLKMGASYHEKVATSEVVQLAAEGIEQVEVYIGRYLPQFYYSMLAPVMLFVTLSLFSLRTAFVLFVCVPLIPLSIIAFQKIAKRIMKKYWGSYTELGDTFLENLQGLTTLKIYQADERRHEIMNQAAEKFRVITMKLLTMQLNSIVLMNLIAFGGAAVSIIMAASEFASGNIALWQAFAIIMLGAEFFIPLRILGSFFHIAMNGTTACRKLFDILDMEQAKAEPFHVQQKKASKKYAISLDKVSFSYKEGNPVLKNVTLQIERGAFVSIVGRSGCGKSTIAGLITGHLKSYQGILNIDGFEANEIEEKEKMQKITLVSHDSYIFKGTVKENLLMGNEHATDEQLLNVLEKVNLKAFIMAEGGLGYQIAEQGSNLSGGQRQRLALARALLKDSDIYLFDEATSNIDVESENDIMKVIHELTGKKTIILICHRLALAKKSDTIYVMENGAVVEAGNHSTLVESSTRYREMVEMQSNLERFGKDVLRSA